MIRWMLLAALALALVGCKGKRWNEHVITTIEIGPFHAPIPAGWRDVREYFDTKLIGQLPTGSRAIMPEEAEADFQSNVIVMWIPVDKTGGMPCPEVADMMSKAQQATRTGDAPESKIGDDRVCTWTGTMEKAYNLSRFRYHGDHILFVQCLRASADDKIGEAGCETFWSSLAL